MSPDLLKMEKMVESLQGTRDALENLSNNISASLDRMADMLKATNDTLLEKLTSLDHKLDRTADSIDKLSNNFEKLNENLKLLLLPLNPTSLTKNIQEKARDITGNIVSELLGRK
ncbi:MAG: hypothetical protein ACTSWN_01425 [Promethearchaeota archaeon]